MIRHLWNKISEIKANSAFGLGVAFKLGIISRFKKSHTYNQEVILNYLEDFFKDIAIERGEIQDTTNEGPVWFCWWQGKAEMPPLVQKCWRELKKNVTNREIIFIDQSNYTEYILLSPVIINRFKKGEISIAHFSDVIRFNLLNKYGGIWLDSTILTSCNSEKYLSHSFFTISIPKTESYVSRGKWSGFAIGGNKSNPLFKYLVDCYNYYWERHCKAIDYLMMDFFILLAYNKSENIKKEIDECSIQLPLLYYLQEHLYRVADDSDIRIIHNYPFSKLTWKHKSIIAPHNSVIDYLKE